jgi:hypothetical protein
LVAWPALRSAAPPFFLHEVNPKKPTETSPGQAGVTSTRIEVFADAPDTFIERAVAAGAIAGSAIEDHRVPWGTHTVKVASRTRSGTTGPWATSHPWARSHADRASLECRIAYRLWPGSDAKCHCRGWASEIGRHGPDVHSGRYRMRVWSPR